MIYFVQAGEGGPIKIGTSTQLTVRMTALKYDAIAGDAQLILLAVMDGGHSFESMLHCRFSHLRIEGEWHEPGSDLLEYIKVEGKEWDGADEVPSREALIAMKCHQEYKTWVTEFARKLRTTPSQLLDRALVLLAKTEGHEEPPER